MKCKLCLGPLVFIGNMGPLRHYRCRNCGMQCSKRSKKALWR